MTDRNLSLTESQFRAALIRQQAALVRGRRSLDQFRDWLGSISILRPACAGTADRGAVHEPLDANRRQFVLGAMRLLLFALRREPK